MLTVEKHTQFDFLSDAYRALFERSRASAFQHPVWLDAFYRHLPARRGAEPVVLTLGENGNLLGVIPLIRRRKFGFAFVESHDLGVSDYAAPILAEDIKTDLSTTKEIQSLVFKALGACDLMRIRPIRPEHLSDWQMLFGGEPLAMDFSAHAVPLKSPMETWRKANVDAKLASQYLRKAKRWRKQNEVALAQIHEEDQIHAAICLLAEMRAGRFEADPIQSDFVRDFYADVATRGAAENTAETWLLTSDGEPAAVVFGITHAGVFHYLLIGADYEGFGRHSPGLQAYDGIIEDWMNRGGQAFDFTIGDEPFKAQFGAQAVAMSGMLIARTLKGRLAKSLLLKRGGFSS